MTRAQKIIGFVLVTFLGAYGCTQGPPGGTDRNTSPAAKAHRLEEDLRAATAARDQFRQRLDAAEQRQSQLQKQLDAERAELKARTAERDAITSQYDGFRKGLKELLAQAEGQLANPSGSISPTTVGAEVAPMPSAAGGGAGN